MDLNSGQAQQWMLFVSPAIQLSEIQHHLSRFCDEVHEKGHKLQVWTDEGDVNIHRYVLVVGLIDKDESWINEAVYNLFLCKSGQRSWRNVGSLQQVTSLMARHCRQKFKLRFFNFNDQGILVAPTSRPLSATPVSPPKAAITPTQVSSGFVAINARPSPSADASTLHNPGTSVFNSPIRPPAELGSMAAVTREPSAMPCTSVNHQPAAADLASPESLLNGAAAQINADDSESEGEDPSELSDSDDFKTGRQLDEPYVSRRTMDDLITLLNTPCLDLNPEYQRDVVWNQKRMSKLIDSLMENFYIPPVIFNRVMIDGPDGTPIVKRVCVDGKQRLTSVASFMRGQIPCHDAAGRPWYYRHRSDGADASSRRRILPDKFKRIFRQKEFVCYEFEDLHRAEEEDLFSRVQMGIPLKAAEKMRATNGPWQNLARSFEGEFSDIVTLASTDRSTGFRNVLTCFAQITELYRPSGMDGKPTFRGAAPALDSFVKNAPLLDHIATNHFKVVFEVFEEIRRHHPETFENNGYSHAKNFAPIELVAVACLISLYHHSRNIDMLRDDILDMRRMIRQGYQALTVNGRVWASMFTYITELEKHRGLANGTTAETGRNTQPRPFISDAIVMRQKAASIKAKPVPPKNRPFETLAQDMNTDAVRMEGAPKTKVQQQLSEKTTSPRKALTQDGGRPMHIKSTAVPASTGWSDIERINDLESGRPHTMQSRTIISGEGPPIPTSPTVTKGLNPPAPPSRSEKPSAPIVAPTMVHLPKSTNSSAFQAVHLSTTSPTKRSLLTSVAPATSIVPRVTTPNPEKANAPEYVTPRNTPQKPVQSPSNRRNAGTTYLRLDTPDPETEATVSSPNASAVLSQQPQNGASVSRSNGHSPHLNTHRYPAIAGGVPDHTSPASRVSSVTAPIVPRMLAHTPSAMTPRGASLSNGDPRSSRTPNTLAQAGQGSVANGAGSSKDPITLDSDDEDSQGTASQLLARFRSGAARQHGASALSDGMYIKPKIPEQAALSTNGQSFRRNGAANSVSDVVANGKRKTPSSQSSQERDNRAGASSTSNTTNDLAGWARKKSRVVMS